MTGDETKSANQSNLEIIGHCTSFRATAMSSRTGRHITRAKASFGAGAVTLNEVACMGPA